MEPKGSLKIAFISQPEYFRFVYEHDLEDFAEVMEFKFNFSMAAEDFSELLAFDANVNFFFRGEFLPGGVLEHLRGVKVNLSSEPFPRVINGRNEYTLDSLNRYITFRAIRSKPFDYVFHYDATSLSFMQRDGLKLSGDFALPVATNVYRPTDMEKRWDIFFIGRSTPHREAFFGPLKHHYNFLHICHGIWGKELVHYVNASKICLNVHAENEVSWEPRLQMMLACGAFVISEPVTSNAYFRPGIDYVEVSNKHEMFDAASHYLNHDEERKKIAQSGLRSVQELLNSRVVFKNLLEGISHRRFPKFTTGKGSVLLNGYSKLWDTLMRLYHH